MLYNVALRLRCFITILFKVLPWLCPLVKEHEKLTVSQSCSAETYCFERACQPNCQRSIYPQLSQSIAFPSGPRIVSQNTGYRQVALRKFFLFPKNAITLHRFLALRGRNCIRERFLGKTFRRIFLKKLFWAILPWNLLAPLTSFLKSRLPPLDDNLR